MCAPCASALASIAPASHAAVVFRGVRASSETNAMARRAAFRAACRVWRHLGNASRTSPRPSPPGQNRANRLTTTIRVFSTRNRISKRIPRRPAAPGRGRTMTFSTGTPPSSDLRTRPTRVAFSSWPFTCVSPPAQLRHVRREREPERARARARNPGARSARTSASTSPRRGSSGSPEAFFASDLAVKKRRRMLARRSIHVDVFFSIFARSGPSESAPDPGPDPSPDPFRFFPFPPPPNDSSPPTTRSSPRR